MSRIATLQRADGTLSAAGAQAAGMQMELDRLRVQLGGLESRSVAALGPHEIASAEFQVFSQFGDDGIIQFLVQRVPVENEVFVEFGVEDYHESNTRFLLVHDNWRGLVMDGGTSHVEFLRGRELAWRHYVDAKTAWVDRDNINGLIEGAGIAGDIGLLSVDIDGNDYWVVEAIDAVSPRILVLEYNSVFGPEARSPSPTTRASCGARSTGPGSTGAPRSRRSPCSRTARASPSWAATGWGTTPSSCAVTCSARSRRSPWRTLGARAATASPATARAS